MVMCDSGDIFQLRSEKLLGDIKGIKTYIHDILVLSKQILSNHIEQLKIVFGRLRATGLKLVKVYYLPRLCNNLK